MNLVQVSADVIGSRRFIDYKEVLRTVGNQRYRK
jgi:hypothetical protein